MEELNFTPEQKLHHDLRHYPVRPHVGVGGVIRWQNLVLLIKRKYEPNAGKWAIPGGHLKIGEGAQTGALRECIEETGLDLVVGELASVIDLIHEDSKGRIEYHYVLVDYFITPSESYGPTNLPIPSPQSDVLDAKFVSIGELSTYDLTDTVIELFKNLDFM